MASGNHNTISPRRPLITVMRHARNRTLDRQRDLRGQVTGTGVITGKLGAQSGVGSAPGTDAQTDLPPAADLRIPAPAEVHRSGPQIMVICMRAYEAATSHPAAKIRRYTGDRRPDHYPSAV
jgi:hypothetical protein